MVQSNDEVDAAEITIINEFAVRL